MTARAVSSKLTLCADWSRAQSTPDANCPIQPPSFPRRWAGQAGTGTSSVGMSKPSLYVPGSWTALPLLKSEPRLELDLELE